MRELIEKYKHNTISESEMINLRDKISSCSDEELDLLLQESDTHYEFTDAELAQLEERIMADTAKSIKIKKINWIAVAAAAVLLPLFIISTIVIYNYRSQISNANAILAQTVSISTSKGENTTYILPDGSSVSLNPMSKLWYSVGDFCKNERFIHFDGEATFEISHDKDKPFTLFANGVKINVLGTNFTLLSRSGDEYAEVYLKNGSIALSISESQEQIKMTPNQKALINTLNGEIEIFSNDFPKSMTIGQALKYYESVPLQVINNDLDLYYNKRVIINERLKNLSFTGLIPTNDFEEAQKILESTMSVSFVQLNDSTWKIE